MSADILGILRGYVEAESDRLSRLEANEYHLGQTTALIKLKARFLLTDDEKWDVEKARREMMGE